MNGSYGGTIWGFLEKLKKDFDTLSFLEKPHVKFLRFYFLKDFWDFLLNKNQLFYLFKNV